MIRLHLLPLAAATLAGVLPLPALSAGAAAIPEIRLTDRSRVPACVTPDRLMRFLRERHPALPAKYEGIAAFYKAHGERLRVRWDFAFFQMIIETNYLLFRNESGRGDVSPSQNNFAGIGTTGGGVPGDSFPDVSTGVLGQLQHLVAYSGERVDNPVARRTREKQDDIISVSQRLRRPVTFRDLAGRWAVDRRYWRSITSVADRFNERFCTGPQSEPEPPARRPDQVEASARSRATPAREPQFAAVTASGGAARPATSFVAPPPAPASRPRAACKVFTASYGGRKNVLIRRQVGSELHYTALQVLDGREAGLTEAFIRAHAEGGEAMGEFPSRDEALTTAFNLCPGGGKPADGRG